MPQIMVEAFARGLVDKIMLEAFDSLDTNTQDGKLSVMNCHVETTDTQSQSSCIVSHMHDHTYVDYNGLETKEIIEKMVHGLRNIQIGDPSSVLTPPLSILEKQIKRVTCHVDGGSLGDPCVATETHITQGQGDVHQIIHDAIIETPCIRTELTSARKERENYAASEAARVSISLLHRMIEELEKETEGNTVENEDRSNIVSKESIAAWEENEEQFIRSIESVEDTDQNSTESPLKVKCRYPENALEREELKSTPASNSTSPRKNVCANVNEVDVITSSPLPPMKIPPGKIARAISNDIEEESSYDKMKRNNEKKKKSLGSRMRKFLLAAFGRRKN